MKTQIIRLQQVDSTNNYLRLHSKEAAEGLTVVTAEFQTAGRGQGSNTWESEPGCNLLMSVLMKPVSTPPNKQFLLSMTGALALKDVLDNYTEGICLKWPNDIYWHHRKLSGTLIDTRLGQGRIKDCIFGIGLNVNQPGFHGDAPNPVSLRQILGHDTDRTQLLQQISDAFVRRFEQLESGHCREILSDYHAALYRRRGHHLYKDETGLFEAEVVEVKDTGHLVLRDVQGRLRTYTLKEVSFIIDTQTQHS